jgi:hypothetical protein
MKYILNARVICCYRSQLLLCFVASDGQELAKIQKVRVIRNSKREGEWLCVLCLNVREMNNHKAKVFYTKFNQSLSQNTKRIC